MRAAARSISLAGLAIYLGIATLALAADFRILAPSAQGSGWDHLAQALRNVLAEERGDSSVEVTNVPGLGGTVGLMQFIAESRDHGLLVTGLTMLDATFVHRAPIGIDRLTPIARLSAEYYVVAVAAASPLKSLDDLRAVLGDGARPSVAGGPAGGVDHVAAILLAKAVGLEPARLMYVPFLTTAEALGAVAEAHVAVAVVPWGDASSEAKAGRVRILGVSSPDRLSFIDAPTLIESGIALVFANWRGVVARPGLDPDAKSQLLAEVARLTASPAWKEMLDQRGWTDAFLPGEAFGRFIRDEQTRVKEALKEAGLLKRAP